MTDQEKPPAWFEAYRKETEQRLAAAEAKADNAERIAKEAAGNALVAYRRAVHAMVSGIGASLGRLPNMAPDHLLELHTALDPQGVLTFHRDDPDGFSALYGTFHYDLIRQNGDLRHVTVPPKGAEPEQVYEVFADLHRRARQQVAQNQRPGMPGDELSDEFVRLANAPDGKLH